MIQAQQAFHYDATKDELWWSIKWVYYQTAVY